jgi:putative acyl-CoA dehydrogenase
MSVWEGSGNVQALDVLRALARTPEARDALLGELELARGGDARLDAELDALAAAPIDVTDEAGARLLAGRLARALQASLLVRSAPAPVADAFCATRLGAPAGQTFGELPAGLDLEAIVTRARPDQRA